jgi:hypothetical protein
MLDTNLHKTDLDDAKESLTLAFLLTFCGYSGVLN